MFIVVVEGVVLVSLTACRKDIDFLPLAACRLPQAKAGEPRAPYSPLREGDYTFPLS